MKLTFDEAIERLADGYGVRAADVLASALRRKIWIAEWHLPGCLSESQSIALTKADAIQCALNFAGDTAPRGMITCLRKYGNCQHRTEMYGIVSTTIKQQTLGDLL